MDQRTCSVEGCENVGRITQGFCQSHYHRWVRYGDPTGGAAWRRNMPPGERFWPKVDKAAPDGCWRWLGCISANGYGAFRFNGQRTQAHRVALVLSGIDVPEGLDVDHVCHTRSCVNPDHLRLTTRSQNNQNYSGARSDSASGIRGVRFHGGRRKWIVGARVDGVQYHGGYFTDLDDAVAAVIELRNRIHTHNDADRRSTITT